MAFSSARVAPSSSTSDKRGREQVVRARRDSSGPGQHADDHALTNSAARGGDDHIVHRLADNVGRNSAVHRGGVAIASCLDDLRRRDNAAPGWRRLPLGAGIPFPPWEAARSPCRFRHPRRPRPARGQQHRAGRAGDRSGSNASPRSPVCSTVNPVLSVARAIRAGHGGGGGGDTRLTITLTSRSGCVGPVGTAHSLTRCLPVTWSRRRRTSSTTAAGLSPQRADSVSLAGGSLAGGRRNVLHDPRQHHDTRWRRRADQYDCRRAR